MKNADGKERKVRLIQFFSQLFIPSQCVGNLFGFSSRNKAAISGSKPCFILVPVHDNSIGQRDQDGGHDPHDRRRALNLNDPEFNFGGQLTAPDVFDSCVDTLFQSTPGPVDIALQCSPGLYQHLIVLFESDLLQSGQQLRRAGDGSLQRLWQDVPSSVESHALFQLIESAFPLYEVPIDVDQVPVTPLQPVQVIQESAALSRDHAIHRRCRRRRDSGGNTTVADDHNHDVRDYEDEDGVGC